MDYLPNNIDYEIESKRYKMTRNPFHCTASSKIANRLSLDEGLDVVLEQLKSLPLERINLSVFEIEMLKEVVN